MNSELVLVLDRSGSMESTKTSAERGLRDFVKDQKKVKGSATLAFYRFDDAPELVFVKDLKAVETPELKLEPRGITALYDAIGLAIDETEARLKTPPEAPKKRHIALKGQKLEEDPKKVIVLIVTDGGENASRKYSRDQIFDKISKLRKDGWEFIFIGANQDALKTGAELGISSNQTISYSADDYGTHASYAIATKAVTCSRTTNQSYMMTGEDRLNAMSIKASAKKLKKQ